MPAEEQLRVAAAVELFGRHGCAATGVAAVAERAGVTPSAVIHHFGSEDNLIRAVLDEFDARAAELVAFLEGALVLWLLDPESTDLRALYENYLRRL